MEYCYDEGKIKDLVDKVELPIFQIKKLDAKVISIKIAEQN